MDKTTVKFGASQLLHGILEGDGARGSVILSHGAGRGLDTPLLEKTAARLADLGFTTLRWNFGYLDEHRAPSSGSKREKAELEQTIEFMKPKGRLILAGKSFGARVSTYVAAERDDIEGLAFYGLPLHGMAKGSKPRDWSHMANIKGRMLFITGDKDRLCSLEHLAEVQSLVTAPFESHVVPGDHSFKPRGEDAALELCIKWFDTWFQ